jgi:hypothetical protein
MPGNDVHDKVSDAGVLRKAGHGSRVHKEGRGVRHVPHSDHQLCGRHVPGVHQGVRPRILSIGKDALREGSQAN